MMAAPVKTGGAAFESGVAAPLFKIAMAPTQTVSRDYDAALDGQRFLIGTVVNDAKATPATIVLNWPTGLMN